MDRLERHHGIALAPHSLAIPDTSLHHEQLTRDSDESNTSQAAAAADVIDTQARLTGARSAEGQYKVSGKPVHTAGRNETAGPPAMSTAELIRTLQKRSLQVLNYLQCNQKVAAD